MKKILNKLSRSPSIPYFHIQFPLRFRATQQCLNQLYKVSNSSPAVFVSLNGISQNPEISNTLHDALVYVAERKRVPIHTFLEDNINGVGYYVAVASTKIIANPFCRMGDLTTPTKSYLNIHKLLKYFGIEYEKIGTKQISLWDKRIGPNEGEKQFTQQWLQVIKDNLKNQIARKRKLQPSVVEQFGSKLIHPKKALQLKIIDEIGTLEEYKYLRFPNNKLKEHRIFSLPQKQQLNSQEIEVLTQMVQYISAKNVILMQMDNTISQCIKKFSKIVEIRLSEPQKLEELDLLIGKFLQNIKMSMQINPLNQLIL